MTSSYPDKNILQNYIARTPSVIDAKFSENNLDLKRISVELYKSVVLKNLRIELKVFP